MREQFMHVILLRRISAVAEQLPREPSAEALHHASLDTGHCGERHDRTSLGLIPATEMEARTEVLQLHESPSHSSLALIAVGTTSVGPVPKPNFNRNGAR